MAREPITLTFLRALKHVYRWEVPKILARRLARVRDRTGVPVARQLRRAVDEYLDQHEGRLQQDTWETDAGKRRSRLKVVAQRVTFLSSAHGQPAPAGEIAPDWITEEAER